jgi:hypothetical protein
MFMRLKVAWFFIKRWDDVIGIIIVALIAFLFAFHMIKTSDMVMTILFCGKIALYMVGIMGLIITIAQFDWRK